MTNHERLMSMYAGMSEEKLQQEIDGIFENIFALLEVTESDSITVYPNPNIELSMGCRVIKDENQRFLC